MPELLVHMFTICVNFLSVSQNTQNNQDSKKKGVFELTVFKVSLVRGEVMGAGAVRDRKRKNPVTTLPPASWRFYHLPIPATCRLALRLGEIPAQAISFPAHWPDCRIGVNVRVSETSQV